MSFIKPGIAPVLLKMAQGRDDRMKYWTESHSKGYGSKEVRIQPFLNQPGQ